MCLEFSHYIEVYSVLFANSINITRRKAQPKRGIVIQDNHPPPPFLGSVQNYIIFCSDPQITTFIIHNLESICGNEIPIYALVGLLLASATVNIKEN